MKLILEAFSGAGLLPKSVRPVKDPFTFRQILSIYVLAKLNEVLSLFLLILQLSMCRCCQICITLGVKWFCVAFYATSFKNFKRGLYAVHSIVPIHKPGDILLFGLLEQYIVYCHHDNSKRLTYKGYVPFHPVKRRTMYATHSLFFAMRWHDSYSQILHLHLRALE